MSENKTNGQIQIADEVVGVIATTAALEVDIIVNFGTKVQNAAKEVQEKVKTTVETMTGLTVAAVNVSICGIVKETEAKAEEEE